jgi:hypothetical protein
MKVPLLLDMGYRPQVTLSLLADWRVQDRAEHSDDLEIVCAIVELQKRRNRTLTVGFGICAALIVGVGVANYRETKWLETIAFSISDNNRVISANEKDLYTVDEFQRGSCKRFEVYHLGEIDVPGNPTPGKPVATFTLPEQPSCKP